MQRRYLTCTICGHTYNVSANRPQSDKYICADCANEIIRKELHRRKVSRIYGADGMARVRA